MEDFVDFLSVPPEEEGAEAPKEAFSEAYPDESTGSAPSENFKQGAERVEEMWVKINKKGEVIDSIDVECLCGRKINISFNYDSEQ